MLKLKEAPILWPPDAKSRLTGKDPDAGKDWGQEEKGTREDKMIGRHHKLNGHESEQALGDGEGHGSLAWCSPWVAKSQTRLSNWTATTTTGDQKPFLNECINKCTCAWRKYWNNEQTDEPSSGQVKKPGSQVLRGSYWRHPGWWQDCEKRWGPYATINERGWMIGGTDE